MQYFSFRLREENLLHRPFFHGFLLYFSCDDGYDPRTNCRKTHCVCKNGGTCDKPDDPCRYKIIKQNENEINNLPLLGIIWKNPCNKLRCSPVQKIFLLYCGWPIFELKDQFASVGVQCAKTVCITLVLCHMCTNSCIFYG